MSRRDMRRAGTQEEAKRDRFVAVAAALAAFAILISLMAPGSTVEVREGRSLLFCMVWLVAASTLAVAAAWGGIWIQPAEGRRRTARVVFAAAASLCIVCVAVATCLAGPEANLRAAVNAAWIWVAIAAAVWAVRSLATGSPPALSRLTWLWVLGVWVLALHGCYQRLVTIPADIERFQRDPDAVLRIAGVDAPPGSAARMLFASRLFDAAPTASFALTNSLACVLVVAAALAASPLLRRVRTGGPAAWAAAAMVLLPLLICLLWTKSRAAYLAAGAAAAVLLAAEFRSSAIPRQIKAAAIAAAAAASAVGLVVMDLWDPLILDEAARSLLFRGVYWRTSLAILLDHPLGIGPGNFQQYYTQYMPADAAEAVADPHNIWLDAAVTGGWAAGIALLVAAAALLWAAVRRGVSGGAAAAEGRVGEESAHNPAVDSEPGWGIAVGVLFAVVLMWFAPASIGRLWDYSVNELYTLLALPAAGLFIYLSRGGTAVEPVFRRTDYLAAAVAAAVVLTFSGEAITAGLGAMIALLAGALAAEGSKALAVGRVTAGAGWWTSRPAIAGMCFAAMFFLLYWSAFVPSRRGAAALEEMYTRPIRDAAAARELVAADPWDPRLWRAAAGWAHSRLLSRPGFLRPDQLADFETFSDGFVARDSQNWQAWWQRGHWRQDLSILDPRWLTPMGDDYAVAVDRYPVDVEVLLQLAVGRFLEGRPEDSREILARAEAIDRATPHTDRKFEAGIVYILAPPGLGVSTGEAAAQRRQLLAAKLESSSVLPDGWVRAEPMAAALRSVLGAPPADDVSIELGGPPAD